MAFISNTLAAKGRAADLTIDLRAVGANYRAICDEAEPAKVAAVVKADAYGLGAARIVPALLEAGCRDFFVAYLSEAAALRGFMGSGTTWYILNGLCGDELECAALESIPVLNSIEQARRWAATAVKLGKSLPAAVQVDSGMSRLGLQPDEVQTLVSDRSFFETVPLRLVMSHLACSEEPENPANFAQLRNFMTLASMLPTAPLSLANSGGIFLGRDMQFDLVRSGIALYGVPPRPGRSGAPRAVVRLDARVIQVRTIPAGTGVGYGLTFAPATEARIATISVGYADGWPRHLSNRGAAYYQGIRLPIVGRISMDSMTLDVTALPPNSLQLGDKVELLGPHQSVSEVAEHADTIPYEILTNLGRRYRRTYLDT